MIRARAAGGSLLFLVVAPGTVTGLVPWALTGWRSTDSAQRLLAAVPGARAATTTLGVLLVVAGAAVLLDGFVRFVVQGLGTPAPVAPTEHLVVSGAYRCVRNPMYVAVVTILVGEALLLGSLAVALWTVTATGAMALFVRLHEEPSLSRRFGAEYADYRARVPRWVPRRPRSSPSVDQR